MKIITTEEQKPILFSTPMVRAILEGKKSQTRRIVKSQSDAKCPYGKVGTELWVRETWSQTLSGDYIYKANYCEENPPMGLRGNWKLSIHMPKDAARIFLKVSQIRTERLHNISEEDALAEGIEEIRGNSLNRYTIHIPKDNAYYNAPISERLE